jgi:hypothetical protein
VIDLPTKHVGHAAAVVDNHIVVVRGAQNAALSLNLHSMSVWEQLPGMVVQNRPFCAAVAGDGYVYVMGGQQGFRNFGDASCSMDAFYKNADMERDATHE